MRIAIIPARGGSKRIPRKNIKPFSGKPMIGFAIEAALACEAIDRVIVSTDDAEIEDVAREFGAELPFRRPAELADDITPTVPVIAHAITACREQGWDVTHACCIYPGVPFIRTSDLDDALALLEEHEGVGYTFPVTGFPSPLQPKTARSRPSIPRMSGPGLRIWSPAISMRANFTGPRQTHGCRVRTSTPTDAPSCFPNGA